MNTPGLNKQLILVQLAWAALLISSFSIAEEQKQRIISLAPHITEVLFAVGAGEEIVGVVSYSDYPPAALDIPRVGSYDRLNYEAILELQPTVIVGWDSGNGEDILSRLQNLGFNVYSHEPRSLEDVGESLKKIGKLTGHEEEGLAQYQTYMDRLTTLRNNNLNKAPVTLFYQLWNEPHMTVNDKHLISDVIRLCGGKNIFGDAPTLAPKVGIESVVARNPEVIIAAGMTAERPEWLDDWKDWPTISAVKNGHLYSLNPDEMHRHTPRILNGAERMCELLEKKRALNQTR